MKLGDLEHDAATAGPALDQPDLLHDELDLEEPNSLLELLVDAYFGDWFEVEDDEEPPAEEEPAPSATPAPEAPVLGAPTPPAAPPTAPAAPPTAPVPAGEPGAPPATAPAAEPKPPPLQAPAADVAPEARPRAGPSAAPDAGGTVPSRPDEVRDRVRSAVGALSHPDAPNPGLSRAKLDQAGAASQARGEVRTTFVRTTPSRIAGPAPSHREPPAPDPGVIPDQIKALRDTFGAKLPPSTLPPLTRSPRGTLPDITGPVLTEFEIGAIAIGERAIDAMASGTDPHSVETRERLKQIRKDLGQATAAAPAPALPTIGPPPFIPGVQVVDEPIQGLVLSPAQRAIFAQVVGQLRGETTAEAQQILNALRRAYPKYPGGILQKLYEKGTVAIGQEQLLPSIAGSLTGAANALANAIQLAPDEIDTAITARLDEVERLKQQALEAQQQACIVGEQTAVNADARVRATAKATADATVRAVAKDRALAKPLSPIQARVERTLADLREPVATELARLDTQLRLRERAIADAVRAQISAIGVAQVRDELALKPKRGEPGTLDSRAQLGEVDRWALKEIAALRDGADSAQATLIAQARTETERLKGIVQSAAETALAALREWGAKHAKGTDAWWSTMDADLQRWATLATAQAELWRNQQGEASRLALAQDLESFQRIVALQQAGDREAVNQYMARLDGEAKSVVVTLLDSLNKGAPDLAGALTAGIRERVQAAEREAVELELDQQVDALQPKSIDDPAYLALESIAEAIQPDFNLTERAGKIHTAVTRWRGFDEEAIFEALSGLSPPAAKILPVYYESKWQNFQEALEGKGHVGHLSKDERRTAAELLRGDRVEGAVGAIHSAISGPGAEIGAVNRILRDLTPDERSRVPERYHSRYDVSLESDLRDQWSLSHAQVDETMAIQRNDIVGAHAVAFGRAISTQTTGGDEFGGGGEVYAVIDRDKAAGVYAQIRKEVEAEATRYHWRSAQIEAEVTLRNRELEKRFDVQAKDEWWARDEATGATRAAFALESGPGRDLLEALADNDMVKADVARLRLEDQGIYAEDAAINAVFREQNARSLADMQRDLGPYLNARLEAKLRDEDATFKTGEERVNRRMELERENAAELAEEADARTRERMAHLGTAYELKAGRSLADMVEANMSGTTRNEARARVTQQGVLSNYQKIKFSIEGWGTDMPQLRSTLAGMSKHDMELADADWQREHPGETLRDAVKGDTSGRDQDDLLDMVDHGAPQTAAEVVAAARRKFDRDRRNDTPIGGWLTSGEIALAEYEVKRLEAHYHELQRADLSPGARELAESSFDIAVQRANSGIELQRQALDSVTDMLANAAAIVTAIVVGAVLSPFTGGGSAVVAAAIISSVCATAVSIGVKQLIKGKAYGREELYTDLAIGAVDALVAALTAGLGNALLGKAARGVTPVAKSSLYQALMRLGAVGRAAASGQARVAGMLGRLGTQGILVRGLEKSALLAGLHESESLMVRVIAKGTAQLIEQGVQAIPSSLTAALLDERVYRQPGGPLLVMGNTMESALHSTAMGLGLAAAHHLGSVGAGVAWRGMGAVVEHLRVMMPVEIRMPTGDVLGHIGTPAERLAEFRAWREANPRGTVRDFVQELKAKTIERWQLADPSPERTRAAREALLADLPPRERGRYADVPIRTVSDSEFARLTGGAGGDAKLLVREGQAVIVLREGAPPTAARALLPEVQQRIFAGTRGMTLEGALPRNLRDTPIRIDTTLPSDEVRVIPIPPEGGPILGVEVVVGPEARPIDVALHAGEVARIRRWTGRLGEARLALADFAARFGLEVTTPRDRARFEAAGELRKLGPIIEERIRRMATAPDPHAAAMIEAQALHLLAQHERARRILTGELVVEPRGYVAAEGWDPKVQGARAVEEINKLRPLLDEAHARLQRAEAVPSAIEREIRQAVEAAQDLHALLVEGAQRRRQRLDWLDEYDLGTEKGRQDLLARLERDFGEAARQRDAQRIQEAERARERALRLLAEGLPVPREEKRGRSVLDLLDALRSVQQLEKGAPARRSYALAEIVEATTQYDALQQDVKRWVDELVHKGGIATTSTGRRVQAGVELSTNLWADPRAPKDYVPHLLEGESLAEMLKHLLGYHAELCMANRIADYLKQQVVEYGDRIGTNGADVTSVDAGGEVFLWDSKNRTGGERNVNSETFTDPDRRAKAEEQALRALARELTPQYTEAMRAAAIKNIKDGNYTTYTVTSQDATTFHSCVEMKFVNHQLVPGSTRIVPVPWGAGI
jgi:hypothetical protein